MYINNNDVWVNAPVEKVFRFFANHADFTRLFGATSCEVIKKSHDGANGLGSVRRIKQGGLSFDEEIVVFEPNQRIEYKIVRYGLLPMRQHHGVIQFKSRNGGTQVFYTIRYEGLFPLVGELINRSIANAWRQHAPPLLTRLESRR